MNVGVVSGLRVAAMLALSAGSRLRPRTEQALAEPERQSLLADSLRALEQKRRRERVAPDRVIEPASDGFVAVQWEERHAGKLRWSDPVRRVAKPHAAGTKRDRLQSVQHGRERWNSG